MHIEQITKITAGDAKIIGDLVVQLDDTVTTPNEEMLINVLASPLTFFFVARDSQSKKIVGMITLVLYHTSTGIHAWIEDLVVDKSWRGKGIATELIEVVLKKAKECRAAAVHLTSRPSRIVANELYKKLGFTKRDTNVYKLIL